jgi:hypothetical protein
MKTIKVFSTAFDGEIKVQSNDRTWGELKNTLSLVNSLNFNNFTATMKTFPGDPYHKMSLISNDAVIPTGDFTILLHPSKQEGANMYKISGKQLTAFKKFLRLQIEETVNNLHESLESEFNEFEIVLEENEVPDSDPDFPCCNSRENYRTLAQELGIPLGNN